MAINDGQRANEQNFNDAFMCRTRPTGTVSVISLEDPNSGPAIPNTQQKINDNMTAIMDNRNDIDVLDATKQDLAEKDQPGGYAGLDANGMISAAALPLDVMQYRGVWDASTNMPALADGAGDPGDVYRTAIAGSQTFNGVVTQFSVGDWVTYNGTTWERSDFASISTSADLVDVDLSVPQTNGQALIWDAASMMWVPGDAGSGQSVSLHAFGVATWQEDSPGSVTSTLTFDSSLLFMIRNQPALTYSVAAGSLQFPANDYIAWVTVDPAATGIQNLTPTIEDISTFVDDATKVVFARRTGNTLFFGIDDRIRFDYGETHSLGRASSGPATNVIEEKFLTADVGTNNTMPDLTFNGLEVGTRYDVRGSFTFRNPAADGDNIQILGEVGGVNVIALTNFTQITSGTAIATVAVSDSFVATGTTLVFRVASLNPGNLIMGNGTKAETHILLEKRNDLNGNVATQPRTAPALVESTDTSLIVGLETAYDVYYFINSSWTLTLSPGIWDIFTRHTQSAFTNVGSGSIAFVLTESAFANAVGPANIVTGTNSGGIGQSFDRGGWQEHSMTAKHRF